MASRVASNTDVISIRPPAVVLVYLSLSWCHSLQSSCLRDPRCEPQRSLQSCSLHFSWLELSGHISMCLRTAKSSSIVYAVVAIILGAVRSKPFPVGIICLLFTGQRPSVRPSIHPSLLSVRKSTFSVTTRNADRDFLNTSGFRFFLVLISVLVML